MPKNKGAGGKNRRRGKTESTAPKELVYKREGEEYAQILRSVGNGFMEVKVFMPSGQVLMRAHIRGSMRKKIWMVPGDIVLVNTRGYSDKSCDILHKYTAHEAKILQARRQLPDNIELNQGEQNNEEDKIKFNDNPDEKNSDEDEDENLVPTQNRNFGLPPSDSEEEESDNDDE